jgi:thiamine pyrophosphate-dependent acetolactate synthase large subunit-like protein
VNVIEVTGAVTAELPDATLVASLGTATSAVREVTGDGPHFYFGGAMGSALAAAMGLAEAAPHRRVVAVLGDGETLMGAGSLWSLSAYRPANLLVVVLADGAYSITGGQAIPVRPRLAEVASALDGLAGASAETPDELRERIGSLPWPAVIEARIGEPMWPGPSPFVDPAAVVRGVRDSVARTG